MASTDAAVRRPADGSDIDHPHAQSGSRIRLEWGPIGAERLAPIAGSPSTPTRGLMTERSVSPSRWVRRWRAVVVPSPNGASISASLAGGDSSVVGACLRNRRAAAAFVARRLCADSTSSVVLVPAGERWPDGSLRPAVEDLWGAGGGVAALEDLGLTSVSEEASAAAAAYRLVEARLGEALAACSSGRELADGGYAVDVAIAGELDESGSVPRLVDGAFVAQ